MPPIGLICSDLLTPRDARALRMAVAWIVAAALSFAAGTLVIGNNLATGRALGMSLAIATAVLSLMAIRAYIRFIRGADELLRKIQVEGLALGFGAGAVFLLSYRLFERLGAPHVDSAGPFLLMIVFWALGQWIGIRRYAGQDGE